MQADRDREALINELHNRHDEGSRLWRHHSAKQMKDWEARTSKLIEMALGIEKRRAFCSEDPSYREWSKDNIPEDATTEEQIRMLYLLERLTDLIKEVNRHTPRLNLFPEFDIQKYHQWLSEQ